MSTLQQKVTVLYFFFLFFLHIMLNLTYLNSEIYCGNKFRYI
jgi:hypothetical protein